HTEPYTLSLHDALPISVEDELAPEIAKAQAVVFDLRTRAAETPGWVLDHAAVVDRSVPVPARRYVFRSGYPPQRGTTSGGYYSADRKSTRLNSSHDQIS